VELFKMNVSIYPFKLKHFYLLVSKNIKMFWEINFKLLIVYWKQMRKIFVEHGFAPKNVQSADEYQR